jgi:hypothetical protein
VQPCCQTNGGQLWVLYSMRPTPHPTRRVRLTGNAPLCVRGFTPWSFSTFSIRLRPRREWLHPGPHVVVVAPPFLLRCLHARVMGACSFLFRDVSALLDASNTLCLHGGASLALVPDQVDVRVQRSFGLASLYIPFLRTCELVPSRHNAFSALFDL